MKKQEENSYDLLKIKSNQQKEYNKNLEKGFLSVKEKQYDFHKINNIVIANLEEKSSNSKYKEVFTEKNQIEDDKNLDLSSKFKADQGNKIAEINEMELNVMEKAKELENEIKLINKKRVDLVVSEFKDKLVELGSQDKNKFIENLNSEFKSTVRQLDEEKNNRLNNIDNLQEKLIETIAFCKKLNEELKERKIEVKSSFDYYLSYLNSEKEIALQKFESDVENHIQKRTNAFRNVLEKQLK